MAKKDKFTLKKEGGGLSFENMVKQAATVAAIQDQAQDSGKMIQSAIPSTQDAPRFMRLPNPQIPIEEYNLVSMYCNTFSNMTRQDFVELAIIEKLHKEGVMPDDDFSQRMKEIRSRPQRGHRKGTKKT